MKNSGFSPKKRVRSFGFAFQGIWRLVSGEDNAKIHCVAAVAVVFVGYLVGLRTWEWVAVVFAIGSVLAAEAFNSAIEALSDKVSPEYDDAIKKTKDLASGAVLLTAIAAAVIGLIIFIPKLMICIN